MSCTQQKQLVSFPKVRVQKHWFRYHFDHKEFANEGTLHLFSLMALYSYANFRSDKRHILDEWYMESPGQWICHLGSLPRIMRVHSKAEALAMLDYFSDLGLISYTFLKEGKEFLRFEITDWKRHCTHCDYNYYSYKGKGFFFFPLPAGRILIRASKSVGVLRFSELDAIMDLWLHTIVNDDSVQGSNYMPVVYFSDLGGVPLLSYSYLAKRWGWSKSRVGRFILKLGESGLIGRVSFSSSHGSVISPCGYREMLYGADAEQLELQRIGEILGMTSLVLDDSSKGALDLKVETCVPSSEKEPQGPVDIRIAVFQEQQSSFFARPVPLIFYSSKGSSSCNKGIAGYRGPPKQEAKGKE